MTQEEDLLRRYLRSINYAEELRLVAAITTDKNHRDRLLMASAQYETVAISLNAVLRSRERL